ncbi:RNA-directed DNA polymerase from mobile element jockey-like, partial [Brachionus plicatilis]
CYQKTKPNIIKILSNKKWGLNQNTLGNLYKSLVGSIVNYSFPCLNSFSENNIKKLQAIQNTAVRSILKLKYDTPSNIVHYEAFTNMKSLKKEALSNETPFAIEKKRRFLRVFHMGGDKSPYRIYFGVLICVKEF